MNIQIDLPTARRFILGRQGLWPGRRWRGLDGVEHAMRALEFLQLDPLQIIARSQDIQLHSRVLEYTPGLWEVVTYQQRKFFDWGGWLAVRPMDELPYWRVMMRRERDGTSGMDTRIHQMAVEHPDTIAEMRAILRERGTVSNRDFAMGTRTRTNAYRGRKDSALALYYLWRVGEVMTHHREKFERVYALAEAVAPPEFLYEKDEAETARFLFRKEIGFSGLSPAPRAIDSFLRGAPSGQDGGTIQALLEDGEIVPVEVEGWKKPHFALGSELPLLQELIAGRTPTAWAPLETTTEEECVFLAPLEPASARGRAKALFGFDYVWEVYKPVHLRKFGYYVLPVLWGDRLVARFDSKLDRASGTFVILGLWLEDEALAADGAFAAAFARGLARFVTFLGAAAFNAEAVQQPLLRRCAEEAVKTKAE